MAMTPTASVPPFSQVPTLHIPTLSRILLWSVRARQTAVSGLNDDKRGDSAAVAGFSSALHDLVKTTVQSIECSSGTEVKTHARIMDAHPECRKSDIIVHQDVFECLNGVNTRLLLLLARRRVFAIVELLGGNAIVDERWSCTICRHETRRGVVYRTSITYQGTPARCTISDPQRPVAMDKARGVPGLMTVVSRR